MGWVAFTLRRVRNSRAEQTNRATGEPKGRCRRFVWPFLFVFTCTRLRIKIHCARRYLCAIRRLCSGGHPSSTPETGNFGQFAFLTFDVETTAVGSMVCDCLQLWFLYFLVDCDKENFSTTMELKGAKGVGTCE